MTAKNKLRQSILAVVAASLWLLPAASKSKETTEPLDYTIELTTARKGFDGKKCWVHARAGVIPPGATGNPSQTPLVVTTMNELLLSGSDVFYATNDMRSTDLGRTWDGPTAHTATMGRRQSARNLDNGNRMDATARRGETRQRQQPLRGQDQVEPAESARLCRKTLKADGCHAC